MVKVVYLFAYRPIYDDVVCFLLQKLDADYGYSLLLGHVHSNAISFIILSQLKAVWWFWEHADCCIAVDILLSQLSCLHQQEAD